MPTNVSELRDGEIEPGRRLDRFRPDDSFGADYDRSRRPDRNAGDAALPSLPDARSVGHRARVQNVSLRIEPNRFVTIAGPSGSGNTTLVKIMLGILEPTKWKY